MDTRAQLALRRRGAPKRPVDADGLAETCAAWASEPTLPLAELMVDRGLMTDEQRSQVEETVARELASHGDDPRATLAATIDGRSLDALGETAVAGGMPTLASAVATMSPQPEVGQGGHVVLGRLSPGETDARERYSLTQLHAKGGIGHVWLSRSSKSFSHSSDFNQ